MLVVLTETYCNKVNINNSSSQSQNFLSHSNKKRAVGSDHRVKPHLSLRKNFDWKSKVGMQMSQTKQVYISPTTLSIVYTCAVLLKLYFTNNIVIS